VIAAITASRAVAESPRSRSATGVAMSVSVVPEPAAWTSAGAVHQRVERGVRQAEPDVAVPARAQVGDGVVGRRGGGLVREVGRETVGGDGVEQALLVAEEAVERGRLHPGGGAHRACRQRVRPVALQQGESRGDDARPRALVDLVHGSTITRRGFR